MENRGDRPMTPALIEALRHITTGTITTVLLKKGIRRCWMSGPMPLQKSERLVGPAFTLRFVPAREDLATPESWSKPISTRGAIEAMPAGCTAVADAMGIKTAGIFEFVAHEGVEHERMEGYIVSEVEKGALLPGLYPMNEETKARYEAWKKQG